MFLLCLSPSIFLFLFCQTDVFLVSFGVKICHKIDLKYYMIYLMDHIALHMLLFQTSLKNSCMRATGCGVSGARRKEKEHQRFGKVFLH